MVIQLHSKTPNAFYHLSFAVIPGLSHLLFHSVKMQQNTNEASLTRSDLRVGLA